MTDNARTAQELAAEGKSLLVRALNEAGGSPQAFRTMTAIDGIFDSLAALASQAEPTMSDAIAAGDGTLHGAIDYWQQRALKAEQSEDGRDAELLLALKDLRRAYVNLLESGRDRIVSLGGSCDPVDVMERNDPHLRRAAAAIAAKEQS